mmetsp:Transcript_38871/g.61431  ORF Transcript_38871/g.61431 Transcript_38871/m.61431 type:complete len:507 (+) Transcript_38871:56-1576(+)
MKRKPRSGDGRSSLEEVKGAIEKRLFIGRLPPDTTEDELRTVFGDFGELTECRRVVGKTMAFVAYNTWAAAHNALRATDGIACLKGHSPGQTIVTSFAERTSTVGRGGGLHLAKGLDNSRVFVGGLPEDIMDDELKEMFEEHGRVEAVQMLPAKTEKRCGFVTFSIWGEALDAIEALDAQPCPKRSSEEPLTVVMAEPKPGTPHASDFEVSTVKRRRVDESSGMAELERLKGRYLQAIESDASEEVCTQIHWSIMSARNSYSWSGGYAAPEANGHRARSSGGAARSTSSGGSSDPRVDVDAARLFIGGLPYDVTEDELARLVQQVRLSGRPRDIELLECRVLPGRGCGYLRFATWEAAEEAQQALNDRVVSGWKLPLRAKWATPKSGGAPGGDHWNGEPNHGISNEPHYSRAPPRRESRDASSGEVDRNRLFVGQITRGVRRQDIIALFEPFGRIDDCNYLEEKGVAYITFGDSESATSAVNSLHLSPVQGISRGAGLNVQLAKPR